MMSERETRECTHRGTKTNRPGGAASPRGPRLQSTLIIGDPRGETANLRIERRFITRGENEMACLKW